MVDGEGLDQRGGKERSCFHFPLFNNKKQQHVVSLFQLQPLLLTLVSLREALARVHLSYSRFAKL